MISMYLSAFLIGFFQNRWKIPSSACIHFLARWLFIRPAWLGRWIPAFYRGEKMWAFLEYVENDSSMEKQNFPELPEMEKLENDRLSPVAAHSSS